MAIRNGLSSPKKYEIDYHETFGRMSNIYKLT